MANLKRRQSMEDHQDAPGLYKWMVVLSSFMLQVLSSGVTYCVGVFYIMFRQNLGGSSSLISFVSSLNTFFFFGIGPLAGAVVRRYGCRGVAILGTLIGALGLTLTAFDTQPWHLIITFGVTCGLGMGLSYIPAITVIGIYFGRRRSLAMGLAVTGLGMGPIIFPPLLTRLEDHFGWRGAILITAGLYLQSVIFATLLRPRPPLKHETTVNEVYSEEMVGEKTDLNQTGDRRNSRLTSLKKCTFSYFSMLTNIPLAMFFIQNVIFSFGLSVINVHIGAYAVSLGYSKDQAAMLFFSMSIGSAISRVLFGLILQLTSIPCSLLYAFTTTLCGVFTVAYPFGHTYVALVALTGTIGVFYGSYGGIPPLITIDIVGVEMLASAYGLICVADGIGFLLGGPAAGWLYDSTAYYPVSFYLGGGSMISSGILMTMIWIFQRHHLQHSKHEANKSGKNLTVSS